MAKEELVTNTLMQVEAIVGQNGSTVIACRIAF